MANGSDRLDRIERILEDMAVRQQYHDEAFERHGAEMKVIREAIAADTENIRALAVRQQYHDEAFERHDSEMKIIREAIAADAENIRALARIAELHHDRLERLEGDGLT